MPHTYIINGRFLTQKLAGVHRYAFEMCCALHQLGCKIVVLAPQCILSDYDFHFEVKKVGRLTSHLWEQIELPYFLNKYYKNNVLISFTGLGPILHRKSICTIHDLSFLENPSWFSKPYYYYYKFLTPIAAKKAIKVITVSEFSKQEIIKRLKLPAEKIEVIYSAVSDKLLISNSEINSKEKYILTVSSLDPRKNLARMMEAFKLLKNNNYKLYIVGAKNKVFGKVQLNKTHNSNIIFTGYLTDSELAEYYKNATIFVYPSLYEGFGSPNIEAMKNNCPVITSNIPPLVEVCQEAALYFDPNDAVDMANKMSVLLANKQLRNELIIKGNKRVTQFTWTKSAKKVIHLLAEI